MAAIPTLEEEDAKRPTRERQQLVGKRTGIVNRMKAAVRLGIRGFNPKLRKAPERLAAVRTPEGCPIPTNTLAALRREMAHLRFIDEQIKQIEKPRLEQLQQHPQQRSNAKVLQLQRVNGLGIATADMLTHSKHAFTLPVGARSALTFSAWIYTNGYNEPTNRGCDSHGSLGRGLQADEG
jgi:transposase